MFRYFLLSFFVFGILSSHAFALSGFVQDSQGVGLEKALIEITVAGAVHRTYSGAQGGFAIDTLPQNKAFSLVAKKSGYSENSVSGNTSDAADFIVSLQGQTVTLSATVLTRDGKPLPNAIVDGKALGVKVSDAQGKVSFNAAIGTAYELKVTLGDYYFRDPVRGVLDGDTERVVAGELN
jgi:hypothetical protein